MKGGGYSDPNTTSNCSSPLPLPLPLPLPSLPLTESLLAGFMGYIGRTSLFCEPTAEASGALEYMAAARFRAIIHCCTSNMLLQGQE